MKKYVRMIGSFAIATTLLGASLAEASVFKNKTEVQENKLSPGVTHVKENYRTNQVYESVNILHVNLQDPYTKLALGVPQPMNQLKTTSAFAKENSVLGHRVIGATNAAFFGSDNMPANIIAENNVIKNYGILGTRFDSPTQQPVAFGVSKNGTALADYYATDLSIAVGNGPAIKIDGVNRARTENQTILFTSAVNAANSNQWGMEIVVGQASKSTKTISFGDQISGVIQSVTQLGEPGKSKIPADGFVISTNRKDIMEQLKNVKPGSPVQLKIAIDAKWQDAEYIVGAGPLLLKDKKLNLSMPSTAPFVTARHPRTAIGVDATGKKIMMVTVDGRKANHSNGTNLIDLANLLLSKGAVSAINLDGGGSTTMVISELGSYTPRLINIPSDGYERRVSAILQAVSVAPPGNIESFHFGEANKKVAIGTAVPLTIHSAVDQYGNAYAVSPQEITWEVSGEVGTVEGQTFTALKEGRGTITARIGSISKQMQVEVFDGARIPHSLNAMNQTNDWRVSTSKAIATIEQSSAFENSQFGKPSLKLNYDFTTADKGTKAAYLQPKNTIPLSGSPTALGVWVHGDTNQNWLRGNVKDANGKLHTVDFTPSLGLNWKGWRYVQAKLPQNLKQPVYFNQIYLVQTKDELHAKGTLYFEGLEAAYSNAYQPSVYFDVQPTHWGYSSIRGLYQNGMVKGYPNGTFKPEHSLTRGEAASLIARILQLKTTKPSPFQDVSKEHFAYADIAAVAEHGIVFGKEEGRFDPNGLLNRAEMAVILTRAFQLKPGTQTLPPFKDIQPSHWAYPSVMQLVKSGLTGGYPDGTYRPAAAISRAEFVVFLDRATK